MWKRHTSDMKDANTIVSASLVNALDITRLSTAQFMYNEIVIKYRDE